MEQQRVIHFAVSGRMNELGEVKIKHKIFFLLEPGSEQRAENKAIANADFP